MRVRAAEFLGLTDAADPRSTIYDVLEQCDDPVEVNLILNTVVLMRDGAGIPVDPKRIESSDWAKLKSAKDVVERRVSYLIGKDGFTESTGKKRKKNR